MKRRELLQAIVAGAATSMVPASASPVATPASTEKGLQHPFPGTPSRTPRVLDGFSRDALHVKLLSDARAFVADQRNKAKWRFGPVVFQEEGPVDEGAVWLRTDRSICEQYPGGFSGIPEGNGFRFWVLDTEGQGSTLTQVPTEDDAPHALQRLQSRTQFAPRSPSSEQQPFRSKASSSLGSLPATARGESPCPHSSCNRE